MNGGKKEMELRKQNGSGMSKTALPYCEKEESKPHECHFIQCLEKGTFYLLGNVGHYQSLIFQP